MGKSRDRLYLEEPAGLEEAWGLAVSASRQGAHYFEAVCFMLNSSDSHSFCIAGHPLPFKSSERHRELPLSVRPRLGVA